MHFDLFALKLKTKLSHSQRRLYFCYASLYLLNNGFIGSTFKNSGVGSCSHIYTSHFRLYSYTWWAFKGWYNWWNRGFSNMADFSKGSNMRLCFTTTKGKITVGCQSMIYIGKKRLRTTAEQCFQCGWRSFTSSRFWQRPNGQTL